jgi:hypothetical protein
MEIKALLGFAIIFALLAAGVAGMFIVGRPGKRRKWPADVGQGGDGGLGGGFSGGSGSDFSGHSGGHSDGGGHGGHGGH